MNNNPPNIPEDLTPEKLAKDLRQSMALHLRQKAQEIISKFGSINYNNLQQVLLDKKYTRYPVTIVFDSRRIESGLFAVTEAAVPNSDEGSNQSPNEDDDYVKLPDQHYEIIVHEHFKDQPEKLLPLVLYQLPVVNYGNVVTYEDSEVFGSEIMGMSQDDYYQLICDLVDSIPE